MHSLLSVAIVTFCVAIGSNAVPISKPVHYLADPSSGTMGQIPTDFQFMGARWCEASHGALPPGAFLGGADGEPLFVGRAEHESDLIPGKVQPHHGVCYVAWAGEEHGKNNYEVLCGCRAKWLPTMNGYIPPKAIVGGSSANGEALFIGRVNHEGTLTVGKVHPSHGVLYVPYGGDEIAYTNYEILVYDE